MTTHQYEQIVREMIDHISVSYLAGFVLFFSHLGQKVCPGWFFWTTIVFIQFFFGNLEEFGREHRTGNTLEHEKKDLLSRTCP